MSEHLVEGIMQAIFLILPFIFGLIARLPQYTKAKSKITESRHLLDEIDKALVDDNITESEFRQIFFSAKRIINKD